MSPRQDVVEPGMGSDGETSGATSGRRTDAARQAIVAEAFEGGSSVSEVAKRRGVSTASIYLWRRQLRDATTGDARKTLGRQPPLSRRQPSAQPPSPVTLVPVRIASAVAAPAPMGPEPIEIALANGRILKVGVSIDPVKLARLVAALESNAP
jgi:transposase-like protein